MAKDVLGKEILESFANQIHLAGTDEFKSLEQFIEDSIALNSKVASRVVKSNGKFSITREPHPSKQHQNQQNGLDLYVHVLDHFTGNVNRVKLYENTKGLHFKKNGRHYLSDFTQDYIYVPFQIIKDE